MHRPGAPDRHTIHTDSGRPGPRARRRETGSGVGAASTAHDASCDDGVTDGTDRRIMKGMATTHTTTSPAYTAKLLDGPLEGKTVRRPYGGDPAPSARIEIPASRPGSRYVYLLAGSLEHDEGAGALPTAAAYRYQGLASD
jgi:hypothetical protein